MHEARSIIQSTAQSTAQSAAQSSEYSTKYSTKLLHFACVEVFLFAFVCVNFGRETCNVLCVVLYCVLRLSYLMCGLKHQTREHSTPKTRNAVIVNRVLYAIVNRVLCAVYTAYSTTQKAHITHNVKHTAHSTQHTVHGTQYTLNSAQYPA
jgi:hypothetical protein